MKSPKKIFSSDAFLLGTDYGGASGGWGVGNKPLSAQNGKKGHDDGEDDHRHHIILTLILTITTIDELEAEGEQLETSRL